MTVSGCRRHPRLRETLPLSGLSGPLLLKLLLLLLLLLAETLLLPLMFHELPLVPLFRESQVLGHG